MKKVFEFYFRTVFVVAVTIIIGAVFLRAGIKGRTALNIIVEIVTVFVLLQFLYDIIQKIIQIFYSKVLIIQKTIDLRYSSVFIIIGVLYLLIRPSGLLILGMHSSVLFGVSFILIGLVRFVKFLKLGEDSITIGELSKRQIKYSDLISFNYINNTMVFETRELNYQFKTFHVDIKQIEQINNIINSKEQVD